MAYRYRVLDKSRIIDRNEVKDEEIENKYIEITEYIGSERDFDELIIPEKIDGYEVVGICREAFRSMATLEINKLIIPDSVSFIGKFAFYDCTISEVILPKNIKFIGESAFEYCCIESVVLPDGLTEIEDYAFAENYIEKLIIPNSVQTIGRYAFYSNTISELKIGSGITNLEKGCFRRNKLKEVHIPSNVITIGESAFSGNKFEKIALENGIRTIGASAFAFGIYNLLKIEYIKIPPSVKKISENVFDYLQIGSMMLERNDYHIDLFFLVSANTSVRNLYLYRNVVGKGFIEKSDRIENIYTDKLSTIKNKMNERSKTMKNSPNFHQLSYQDACAKFNIETMFIE